MSKIKSIPAQPTPPPSASGVPIGDSVEPWVADRRALLVKLIVDHYLAGNKAKLKLVNLAKDAGISRQALDRYYGDLKPYIAGRRDVVELVEGTPLREQVETQTAINEIEAKYEKKLEKLQVAHERALDKALSSHITSLMNSDVVLLEGNKIRSALEKQTLHNAELLKQISSLELKLMQSGGLIAGATALGRTLPDQNKLIFNVDIETLSMSFKRNATLEAFETAKSNEIRTIRDKISKYQNTPDVHVVMFADRYISRFSTFAENYTSLRNELSIIVRLPLFSRSEFQNFIKQIPTEFKRSIHIPYSASDNEKKAQRTFIYQKFQLPPTEIKGADTATNPSIEWGIDEVVFFKIKQGD
ncbi:hypothetical protein [Pseudomonas sp. yb_9]|uniref:hypothetical protein n=1 Tax=Pseudomonas sp. yb_9 TaxID=3367222 RepID=UPI00370C5EB3